MNILRALFVCVIIVVFIADYIRSRATKSPSSLGKSLLAIWAVVSLLMLGYLMVNHAPFPLHLEVMEGSILQHLSRVTRLEPLYPEPSPEFVPLAYNPLYYFAAVPFTKIFGVNLLVLRITSIAAVVGSLSMIYAIVKEETGTLWWSLIAIGLFGAAYRVMDAYLDTAHADSWFLFTVLLGTYCIKKNSSFLFNLLGVIFLCISFWFKQHGAIFAAAGVLYLTWREGIKNSIPYWLTALLLGPVCYFLIAPQILGERFLYFTWEVPKQWTEYNFLTFRRIAALVIKSYPLLGVIAGLTMLNRLGFWNKETDVVQFQGLAAASSALLGAGDPGSSDNVFIPLGIWIIILGILGLYNITKTSGLFSKYQIDIVVLFLSFVPLLYDPRNLVVPWDANRTYRELIQILKQLDGEVYAPSQAYLGNDLILYPNGHWVALEDMIRGPGNNTLNHPMTISLLRPAIEPSGNAYIIANYPLTTYPWISFLEEYYVLDRDFGDQFKGLSTLPGRWDSGWPRYLYRYQAHD